MSSQDLGATHRDSSVNSFFSSVDGINSLLIGGNDDNKWGYEMHMRGTIYFVEIYSTPFTEELAEAKIKESSLSFPGGVSYIRTGERTFQFGIQPPIGDLEATYRWEFPGRPGGPATAPRAGMISTQQRPTWTAPTGRSDPFKDDVPAKVTVTATISSPGAHHGYAEKMTLYVAPDAGNGITGRASYFENWVFRYGEDGFGCFRIPTIIRAGNGDLLAFIEARPRLAIVKENCYDHQEGISVAMKRSVDDGRTWGPLQIVAENIIPTTGRRQIAQNVTAVLDETDPDYQEGKIVIVYSAAEVGVHGSLKGGSVRRVITAWSGDHGHTWNWDKIDSPTGTHDGDITNQASYPYAPDYTAVYDADYAAANYNKKQRTIHVTRYYDISSDAWAFVMPTLGHSIQLKHGDSTKGRLFISGVYGPISVFQTYNYVFWSDDHGKTWEIGGQIEFESAPTDYLNEATAVELENGDVLINSRAHPPNRWNGGLTLINVGRVVTTASFDSEGKVSFSTPTRERDLTTSGIGIAAGMTRITTSDQDIFGGKSRIAFTAPNDLRRHAQRNGMSFWMSTDEGKRWNAYGSRPKLLNTWESIYSDIVALPDTRVGILHAGAKVYEWVYGGVLFTSASLHWLSDGDDQRALVRRDASSTGFDGSSGFVDLSSQVGEVDDMTEGSVVVTFKTGGVAGGQTLFSVSDSSDADSVWSLVQTGDGRFGVYARNDSTDVNLTYFDRDLVTDGLWHRMAVTVGSDGTDVYVDGEHVAHTESTGFFADVDGLDAMDLGRVVISGGAAGFWDGSIGTVEVFDGVLTAEQAVAATQPAAMPVAAFHVDQDLTADQAISMATAPGGTDLVADHLPQWECNELAASWAIGTTFTAPDSVTDQATVFQSQDSVTLGDGNQLSTASLMLGIWGTDGRDRIGLRYDSPATSEWDLSVPFDAYSGQKVSMIAVMGPVNSYLIINGQTVATTPTPVPEGPHNWHPANTTIGTTNTDHTLDTNLKTLAIWKGVVPSNPLAQSLTLAHNITR